MALWGRLAVGLLTATVAGSVMGQDTSGGITAEASIGQRLVSEDGNIFGETPLSFAWASATRTSALSFRLDGVLTYGEDTATDGLTDPSAVFSYATGTRDTRLEFDFTLSERDIITPGATGGVPGALIFGNGTRRDQDVTATLLFGQEAKFGGTLVLGASDLSFSDPAEIPAETRRASLDLRFEVDPRITLTTGMALRDIDRGTGGVDERRESLDLGVDLAVTRAVSAELSIGYADLTVDGVNDRETTGSAAVIFERPDGALSFSFDTDLTTAGRRSSLEVGRDLTFRNGTLSAGLGVSRTDDDSARPLYRLSYGHERRTSTLAVSLSQEFDANADGEEILNTRASLDVTNSLSEVTSFNGGLGYAATTVTDGVSDDTASYDLSLGLSHAVNDRLSLETGYAVTRTSEGGTEETTSRVFIGISSNFAWRP